MKLELTQKLEQQQILAPQMILSMDILLLAVTELEQRIEKEFAENPALEIEEPAPADPETSTAADSAAATSAEENDLYEKLETFQNQSGYSLGEGRSRRRSAQDSDDRLEMLQNTEGKPAGLK